MAYKDTCEDPDIKSDLPFFWNIHKSVGWGCPNRTDDVMLVQFLLLSIYLNTEVFSVGSPPTETFPLDGIFGQKTYKWIRAFQKTQPGYHQDGRVSAIDGSRAFSTETHHPYTIIALNAELSKYPHFQDLRMDPNLPATLAQVLS